MELLGPFLGRVQFLMLFGWKYTAGAGATLAASQTAPYRGRPSSTGLSDQLQPFTKRKELQFSLAVIAGNRRQNHSSGDHGREICHEVACLFDLASSSLLSSLKVFKNIKEVIAATIKLMTNLTWVGSRFHANEKSVTHATSCGGVYDRSLSAPCQPCQKDFRGHHRALWYSAFRINFLKVQLSRQNSYVQTKAFHCY